ncbi:hypothetical protein BJ138DRAFT_1118825 [Hygrophoropsis aurantiaca]|uniref:Uncharacterized protein n=1 Tax=Hygrophoropsis aurantiaca TaxID=72124 RepID=A0ACB7ZVG9_9AGAM|nr:hypothetical protein BJ138DRAFT_1118825 [Hygrophoropsis aurantiaca]
MSNVHDPTAVYANRRIDGLYDTIVDQALALPDHTALAVADYNTDFVRSVNPHTNNFSYVGANTGREAEMILFGQITPAVLGTKFSARGDFYAANGDENALIDDKTRVKFAFNLCQPFSAPKQMGILFDNQIATLNEIMDADADELKDQGKSTLIKRCTSSSVNPTDPASFHDLINIKTGPIYIVPKDSKPSPAKKSKITKRSIDSALPSDEVNETVAIQNELSMSNEPSSPSSEPHTITTNDLYDPTILYDYGGHPFAHVNSKLRQLDMRNKDNNLVRPEEWYSTFRPGALIMARVRPISI